MCLDDVLTSVSTPWVHYATEHVVRKCRRHILFSVQKCETMPTPGICLMGVLRDRGGVSWNFWVGGCPNTPPPVGVGQFWLPGCYDAWNGRLLYNQQQLLQSQHQLGRRTGMLLQQLLTVNRLLIWLQKFAEIWCSARDLCPALVAAWVGGSSAVNPPPPPMGVGHFWVLGFSKILGGWVLKFSPPPPSRH